MPDQPIHALAHLGCGLICEGHSQDGIRSNSKIINKMRDPMSDDPRLARTGASEDQDRSIDLLDTFSLLRIEFTEVQLSQFTGGNSSRESRVFRGFLLAPGGFGTHGNGDAHQGNGNHLSLGSRVT